MNTTQQTELFKQVYSKGGTDAIESILSLMNRSGMSVIDKNGLKKALNTIKNLGADI